MSDEQIGWIPIEVKPDFPSERVPIMGARHCLVRWHSGQTSFAYWYGDHWDNIRSGGNYVTHYLPLDTIPFLEVPEQQP